MDGLSRAVGIGPTITLCGRTFNVRGKILQAHAEIEAEIIKGRLAYLKELKKMFADDKEAMKEIIRESVQSIREASRVTLEDQTSWLSETFRGYSFLVYQCIRHNADDLTLDKVTKLICQDQEESMRAGGTEASKAKREEIEAAIDQASGEDELGNSTGPGNGAEQTAATAQSSPGDS